MVKQWKLTSSTCLVLLSKIIFLNGEKNIQDHPNYTFEELEQAFCKQFKMVNNDEEVYMQLWNIQQPTIERVEIYYEHLLKLTNYL